jgi:hypothetical protein|tara:strand:- start:931 stop:1800 length:870 start_codon:yes stop_codon:yes gene_type:complete
MSQIYLVCTRSAISASALTYIINQSPQFYNVVHNNLWLNEAGSKFKDATVIEDWWNIPKSFAKTYNHDVRNNENIKLETLQNLCNKWGNLHTGKHIALFTHATNTADIIKWRNEHELPITVVTTIMGENCYHYIDLFLQREYSNEMNKFVSLFDTWKYLYNQFLSQDVTWAEHADVVLAMDDWLNDPAVTYFALGIFPNHNMKIWVEEYKMANGYEEWNLSLTSTTNRLKTMCYIFGKYESLFQYTQEKRLFALATLESGKSYKENEITDIQQIVDNTQKIIRKQLTLT